LFASRVYSEIEKRITTTRVTLYEIIPLAGKGEDTVELM